MPDFSFVTRTTAIYDSHNAAWAREERRLYGGDAVLRELVQWKAEEPDFYNSRLAQAGYITLPKLHASTLTGHLSGATPLPNFAELGEVRRREEIDRPSEAELLWYNVGIGNDGEELIPWIDGVQERAIATGMRWILVELPSRQTLINNRLMQGRNPNAQGIDFEDVKAGYRPYPVEYSPLSVPFWQFSHGRLDFAVVTIDLIPDNILLTSRSTDKGYYILVRRGYRGLGADFAQGGWWKVTETGKQVVESGNWEDTGGQIPLFLFIGEPSPGTFDRPSIARSLTMELGQIAVSLMNRISERNWNMMQAAKSANWIMGINPKEHAQVVQQQDLGSITYGVPPVMGDDGRVFVPQMWNSSSALLDASAFEMVIKSGLEEAREIMIKQITSTPDASGESKRAGFAEATSPLLRRLAATRQSAMNTLLYFASLRFGHKNPQASITIPREFRLAPLVDETERGLNVIKRSWLRSITLEVRLLMKWLDQAGLLPDSKTERDKIQAELVKSATATEPVDELSDDAPDTPGRQGFKPPPAATPTPSNGATPTKQPTGQSAGAGSQG